MTIHETAFSLRDRLANRIGHVQLRFHVAKMGDRRGLSHPVSLANSDSGQVREARRKLRRERRRAGLHVAHLVFARESILFRRLTEAINEGRHKRQERWMFFDQKTQKSCFIEARYQHQGSAYGKNGIEYYVQAVDVVER